MATSATLQNSTPFTTATVAVAVAAVRENRLCDAAPADLAAASAVADAVFDGPASR